MSNNKVIFNELEFNGFLIQLTQSDGFDTMINATEMWKSMGSIKTKQPYEFLRLPGTKEYLEAFNNYTNSEPGRLRFTPVITIKGNYADGTRQGTWMHRWVAIRYAQWLNPSFAIWVDSKIDDLLRNGFTVALQEERDKYNKLLPKYNSILPESNYYREVLTYSENLYSTEQLCKDLNLGYSAKILLKKLEDLGYIYRRDKYWFLSSPYDKEGYTKIVTKIVVDRQGNKHSRNIKKWTESGKYFIWSLSKKL